MFSIKLKTLKRMFFEDYVFAWWNIWIFIILLFALRYFLMLMARPQCDTPLVHVVQCWTVLTFWNLEPTRKGKVHIPIHVTDGSQKPKNWFWPVTRGSKKQQNRFWLSIEVRKNHRTGFRPLIKALKTHRTSFDPNWCSKKSKNLP
jgi:hypothetical protein